MKRFITIIAAAVAAFCLSSCTTEEDAVYIIQDSVEDYTYATTGEGEAYELAEEFKARVIAFEKQHSSNWKWKVTIKNKKFTDSDNDAITKYNSYRDELKSIMTTYQAKFDACTEKTNTYLEESIKISLIRVSGDPTITLAEEIFSVYLNTK